MKIVQIITIAIVSLFFTTSCASSQGSEKISVEKDEINESLAKDVKAAEFNKLITSEVIILDVRRPVEYNSGHVENAININFFDDDFVDQVSKLDKSKTLLIYCASGGRSSGAMTKLKDKGFPVMYNLLGGCSAWQGAGYMIVQ